MSLARAHKSVSREHRERDQPAARKKLGLLEKKSDWITRTRAHQKKSKKLRKLRRQALERNRDEFDFHMVNAQVGLDGVHRESSNMDEDETRAQALLGDIRDLSYVQHKLTTERSKIDKMKSRLHFTDLEKPNKHIIFVEDDEEAANFNPAAHFGTSDELLERASNRITISKVQTTAIDYVSKEDALYIERQRHQQYTELNQRIEREKELNIVRQKLELKKALAQSRGHSQPRLVARGDKTKPAVFKWKYERKK